MEHRFQKPYPILQQGCKKKAFMSGVAPCLPWKKMAEMAPSDLFAHLSQPLLRSIRISLLEHPASKQSLWCFSIPWKKFLDMNSACFFRLPRNSTKCLWFLVREVSHVEWLCRLFRSLTCRVLFNSSSLTAFFSSGQNKVQTGIWIYICIWKLVPVLVPVTGTISFGILLEFFR